MDRYTRYARYTGRRTASILSTGVGPSSIGPDALATCQKFKAANDPKTVTRTPYLEGGLPYKAGSTLIGVATSASFSASCLPTSGRYVAALRP